MNNQELIQKKINLHKSIMSNPKLAKIYSDGMGGPIGSTKRSQAQAIFRIQKKKPEPFTEKDRMSSTSSGDKLGMRTGRS